ncbi:hypothetical protein CFIO01_09991 [Colletotrichum fioriniae PJ7]|uniref:Uncharacterized protein n=1 Tax=Colletotrichum fioriniae PJ7 TaxID=1445577 RepID=A0A010R9T2_9PEZI|nr:hypothetical protein CFIO01_09991 [Colletotrichum fioriniae PJ7]
MASSVALRGLGINQLFSLDWETVSILSDSMPTDHLFLEGPLFQFPIQEGQGLRNHSDITFYKIRPGSARIGHLINLPATKLSAFRYIAEDYQEPNGQNWNDPMLEILYDLNSSQGKCLKTLCLGLFNPPRGYSGLPVSPSMGSLEALTHLWIDSGKRDARWTYETIRSFTLPNHYAPNLVHLRITGPIKNLAEWISFMRTEGRSVWKHLKTFGINNEDLVKLYSQSLESLDIKLELIEENDDITLWNNQGKKVEVLKDVRNSIKYVVD